MLFRVLGLIWLSRASLPAKTPPSTHSPVQHDFCPRCELPMASAGRLQVVSAAVSPNGSETESPKPVHKRKLKQNGLRQSHSLAELWFFRPVRTSFRFPILPQSAYAWRFLDGLYLCHAYLSSPVEEYGWEHLSFAPIGNSSDYWSSYANLIGAFPE